MRSLLRSQILRNLNRQCDNTACIAPVNAQRLITHRYSTSTSLSTKTRTWSLRPSQQQNQPAASRRRSFINLANILQNATNNNNGNNNNNNQEIRTLRATRTLPFPPSPLYEIISSVESYAEFLPFLAASTVTARDPQSGYPSQAFLTVGYGPFKETFTSRVTCDRSQWVVEARSGGGVGDDGRPVPGDDEGLFSHLSTKWQLVPETEQQQQKNGDQVNTQVQLEIRFRFQNAMHTAMMGAVEDKVAAVMIEAFERRIKEEMVRKL
ncbi:uncharacterized protein TRUGW13939_00802 [Talaromyces rugulosus]|uniref:Coenzyme Q-binding protein COQ10 START domain-containing protein n=1 Tax=Talaromyces rugulosus TaxID=121627 RepID=A0A7H8QJ91_TALRU|nr:uncharacterized protein TRUGW13939_00802 [Talaromyces rugulosus]QKX53722.1 hypothetical protein TRUGW13939_00802 [Talaromyces rugulosus]